ncbi:unnamed protein product, partial [Ectocarpus fasciculatus]
IPSGPTTCGVPVIRCEPRRCLTVGYDDYTLMMTGDQGQRSVVCPFGNPRKPPRIFDGKNERRNKRSPRACQRFFLFNEDVLPLSDPSTMTPWKRKTTATTAPTDKTQQLPTTTTPGASLAIKSRGGGVCCRPPPAPPISR